MKQPTIAKAGDRLIDQNGTFWLIESVDYNSPIAMVKYVCGKYTNFYQDNNGQIYRAGRAGRTGNNEARIATETEVTDHKIQVELETRRRQEEYKEEQRKEQIREAALDMYAALIETEVLLDQFPTVKKMVKDAIAKAKGQQK